MYLCRTNVDICMYREVIENYYNAELFARFSRYSLSTIDRNKSS